MENQNDQNLNPTPPVPPVVQSSPVSSPVNPPPGEAKSKLPILIIGIILFLLIVGSAAGFYIFKQETSKITPKLTPAPSPAEVSTKVGTPDPTANWKTYTGEAYSIQYPTDFTTVGSDSKLNITNKTGDLNLQITTEPTSLDLNNYVDQKSWCINIKSSTGKSYIIDSENSLRFEKTPCGQAGSTDIYTIHNGIAYHLSVVTQETYEQNLTTLNQILSTFTFAPLSASKFTGSQTLDTSNWKTYTNSQGYTLKYPEERFVQIQCPDDESNNFYLIKRDSNEKREFIKAETCARDGKYDLEISTLKSSYSEPITNDNFAVEKSTINVGGAQASQFVSVPKRDDCPCYWSTTVNFSRNEKDYLIHFGLKDETELLDQVLSTFRFTN